jgi:hypothetical protein
MPQTCVRPGGYTSGLADDSAPVSPRGTQPLLDDCLWHYKNPDESIKGVITTHVDDLAITCRQTFLDEQFKLMTKAFGKISLQMTPFTHCGCQNTKIPNGYKMDQQAFVKALKTQDIENTKDGNRPLTAAETTKFRSILGGLLWLTTTRLDLIADVGILQSKVTKATVNDFSSQRSGSQSQAQAVRELGPDLQEVP